MAGEPPAELLDRARALRAGTFVPAAPRDAATVALLRSGPGGPEVYLLRRVAGMVFGGMHAFPGGSVDPADAQAHLRWAGPPPAQFATAFGCDEPLARALVCAAVRETFEEAGVLLAGPSEHEVLADVSTAEWEAERAALEDRRQSLSELLERRGLVLRADLLSPLAHWVTPEVEPRRFDTRFFVAEVPAGQVPRDVGGEASDRLWVRPADALGARGQELAMLPPTAAALRELSAFADADAAVRAERAIVRVLPVLLAHDDGRVDFLVPGDPGYPDGGRPGPA